MRTVTAYSASQPKAAFEKTQISRRDLLPNDVLVKIAFAGICHSDIHSARSEWGGVTFPLVPGHEIAGTVEAVGDAVEKFDVGDRVGVGVIVDSCRECENCLAGAEQYCLKGPTETYNSIDRHGMLTYGGYSTHIVVDERYVLSIPDGVGLDAAAPLLCAGITLYSPLKHWNAGPGQRVAVVGLGGLGHMGIKIAHALGSEVTVLSQTLSKETDGRRLGADKFFATSDPETFEHLRGTFDLILNTVSVPLPLDEYIALLRLDGTLVNVGLPPESLNVSAFSLINNRKSLSGSMIGGIAETQEMLDFCALHELGAEIEVIQASEIDAAYDRVVASDVRYRFVIDASSM